MIQKQNITINGINYQDTDLTNLINKKIKSKKLWEKNIFNFLNQWFNNYESITLKTSGSTGKPKEIVFSKNQLILSAKTSIQLFNLHKESTALLCLPAEYVAAKLMIVRAIIGQLNLIIIPPDSNPLKNINTAIDFAAMVPLQVINSLNNQPLKINLIKKLIIGGQKLPEEIAIKLSQFKTNIWETYGMTETLTHVALREISPSFSSTFIAIPGNTFQTYNNCLTINNSVFLTEEIKTNDIVNLISNNEFKYIGRIDNIINSGGIKISIDELESKLMSVLTIPFAISSITDQKLGDKIVLVIEKSKKELNIKNIIKKIKLTKFETPKEIVLIDKIPLTPSNKTDRKALKKAIENIHQEPF
ncbi:MAG: AMP-binding protein [Marinilabiliaceae bacterium]|nr:AMP-binding protein [Marinilabiliaceae bacterium]